MASTLLTEAGDGPAVRGTRVGVWRTVLACEWRLLRGDLGWWLVMALLVACTAYALHSGQARLAERAAAVDAAKQDEARRLQTLRTQLGRLEASGLPFAGESFADPGNALSAGRGNAAPVVALQGSPLGVVAVGLADLYPPSFKVTAASRDRFLFVDEIANPSSLAAGNFDVAFVVVYLYPLLLLALSYNVLSGEREQGTLALTQASSAPLASVLLAKLALRGGGAALALLVALGVGLLMGGGLTGGMAEAMTQATTGATSGATSDATTASLSMAADTLAAAAALGLAVLLYGILWLALALWVNTWRRDSAFNAVALVVAWLLLLLVLPAAVNATAMVMHPAPARAEMVLAVRQAAIDTDRDREAEQARFAQEHGGARQPGAAQARTLALLLAADQRADAVLSRHEALVRQQRDFSDRLAYIAPPMLMNDLMAEMAGNGHTRFDAQLARLSHFHQIWQGHFVAIAQRGARLSSADLAQLPRADSSALPVWSAASASRVVPALVWMALWAVGLLVWACRRLRQAG